MTTSFDETTRTRLREVLVEFDSMTTAESDASARMLAEVRAAVPFVDRWLTDSNPLSPVWQGHSFWEGYSYEGTRAALRFAHFLSGIVDAEPETDAAAVAFASATDEANELRPFVG